MAQFQSLRIQSKFEFIISFFRVDRDEVFCCLLEKYQIILQSLHSIRHNLMTKLHFFYLDFCVLFSSSVDKHIFGFS